MNTYPLPWYVPADPDSPRHTRGGAAASSAYRCGCRPVEGEDCRYCNGEHADERELRRALPRIEPEGQRVSRAAFLADLSALAGAPDEKRGAA